MSLSLRISQLHKRACIINKRVFVLLIAAGITGSLRCDCHAESSEISIGAILPLSGKDVRAGSLARFGIEKAHSQALVDGVSLSVFFEDSQGEATKGVAAFQKVTSLNNVDAVIALGSPVAMALSPLANSKRVPLIAIVASPKYSSPNDYTFRISGSSQDEAIVLAKTIHHNLRAKKIAILGIDGDFGRGVVQSLRQANSGSFQIVYEALALPETTDFRTQLLKVKQLDPDLIFLAAWAVDAGLILKQARELGIASRFLCGQACQNPDLLSVAGSAAEGLLVTVPADTTTSAMRNFYLAKLREPPTFLSLRMEDAMQLILAAAKSCPIGVQRRPCIRSAIQASTVRGTSIPLSFDENGDIREDFLLKIVKDGEYVATVNLGDV